MPSRAAARLWLPAQAASAATIRSRSVLADRDAIAVGPDRHPGRRRQLLHRQVLALQRRAGAEQHRPLHHVLELADVPGPGVASRAAPIIRRGMRRRLADPARGRSARTNSSASGRISSLRARSGGMVSVMPLQPEVEVLAERAALDLGLEVAVRRRDEPDVDPARADAAEARHLARLDHAQKLGLGRPAAARPPRPGTRVPPRRRLQQARLGLHRAGERAPLVPEQLALQQRLGQRRAVEADIRSVAAAATRGGPSRASSSLPTPVSPVMRTLIVPAAARSASCVDPLHRLARRGAGPVGGRASPSSRSVSGRR